MFAEKTLLITGGTGTFGNAVLARFLSTEIREIRVFSRDEKKQDDMRRAGRSMMGGLVLKTILVTGAEGLRRQEPVGRAAAAAAGCTGAVL